MVFGKACNIAENLIDFDETQRKQTPDTQNDNVRTIAVHSVPLQHAGTLARGSLETAAVLCACSYRAKSNCNALLFKYSFQR